MTKNIEELKFINSYSNLHEDFYSKVEPACFKNSYLISSNPYSFKLLDMHSKEAEEPNFIKYFTGEKYLPKSNPLAMIYAGHQFGNYVEQLGDGRALLLGEVINDKGQRWEIHAKGSGQTPYSRGFDGRAVLRSSIREYLASEAMSGLGIPTTRALCLIGTGEIVIREKPEKGALIIRLASTHIRFGSFELFYYRGKYKQVQLLADYCIENHYSHLINELDKYKLFFKEIVERTAKLIANWMAVGFTHGVLNTDNMSIIGITIDYGPYGFIDNFDYNYVPNHSDFSGRYSYKNQPYIGLWNLTALAEALQPVVDKENSKKILDNYSLIYQEEYLNLMKEKLGLFDNEKNDEKLITDLLNLIHNNKIDYTIFFRKICDLSSNIEELNNMFQNNSEWKNWLERYLLRIDINSKDRINCLNGINPKLILRNYIAEVAIRKADSCDYSEINKLLRILHNPFDESKEHDEYANFPPKWSKEICISCSS